LPFWFSLSALFYPLEIYTFDRDRNQFTLIRKGILGKASSFEYKFEYISEIKLEEKEVRNQEQIYAIAITINKNGKIHSIYEYKSKEEGEEIVNLIQKYLEA
jgi:hypothetical protein